MKEWAPTIVTALWMAFVAWVAGWPAAFFAGLTGLAACLFCLWEVGRSALEDADALAWAEGVATEIAADPNVYLTPEAEQAFQTMLAARAVR